ncbi:menaquinone biosynthesis protein [Halosquirtibacter xylanolyticus]|uniref:menaquinone biosynthetic enzyme MqnA/MqnD family protein n=1 Tax=Halosquirtibacter xylanolyticus TaxID=3374599 RepID=UPI0037498A00|nr:menaquinone biosynthesis protein [Prolixibacteraceae bacterium]
MKKVKISAVSYLNSKPMVHGIMKDPIMNSIDLALDHPADCAKKLLQGDVDLGLVPVAILPKMKEYHIVSDYCIGGDGPVHTVVIASDVPLHEIQTIYLDYQSRTSVMLCQILCRFFWNITPEFKPAYEGYHQEVIGGTTAAVVIGDRVFDIEHKYKFMIDLSDMWKKSTGEPFVFAAWVANKPLDSSFVDELNNALKDGCTHLDETIEIYQPLFPKVDIAKYFEEEIVYDMTEDMHRGLDLFLQYVHKIESE